MTHAVAGSWGRCIGRYSREVVNRRSARVVLEVPLPAKPSIWFGWHETNLITIAMHRLIMARPVAAFVPAGAKGAAMRGWLEAMDVRPVFVSDGVGAGGALRAMRRALSEGADVLIAADGPGGPRHVAKTGALLLAWKSGADVLPVGCAASPALRAPRWDRHLVPLPGARVLTVMGAPIPSCDPRSVETVGRVAATLHGLTAHAQSLIEARGARNEFGRIDVEASTWK